MLYLQIHAKPQEYHLAKSLKRVVTPHVRRLSFCHYLVETRPHARLAYIQRHSRDAPIALRFDIVAFFPTISHVHLLTEVPKTVEKLTGRPLSRRLRQQWNTTLPAFLNRIPSAPMGLPIGHPLSHILAALYLLDLDRRIPNPTVRVVDDYLILCRSISEARALYFNEITPFLTSRGLRAAPNKVEVGSLQGGTISFLGFRFAGGRVGIDTPRIATLKKDLSRLTSLRSSKPPHVVIKLMNRRLRGFGHYYKHADCLSTFDKLDAFSRARLRRYIARSRATGRACAHLNTHLTNRDISELGLVSLGKIFRRYKDNHKRTLSIATPTKTSENLSHSNTTWSRHRRQMAEVASSARLAGSRLEALAAEIRSMTKSLNRVDKRLSRIERLLASEKDRNS